MTDVHSPRHDHNPLRPNISMDILHTFLFLFFSLCQLTSKSFFSWFISSILVTLKFDSGVILYGEIRF